MSPSVCIVIGFFFIIKFYKKPFLILLGFSIMIAPFIAALVVYGNIYKNGKLFVCTYNRWGEHCDWFEIRMLGFDVLVSATVAFIIYTILWRKKSE